MTRTFIMTNQFDKDWKRMGLNDDDLKSLQEELLLNPTKGDLIVETGGLRKLRIAFKGKGKSGSGRVCYVDFAIYDKIYLITAYPKNEKDNLSKSERNEIFKMIGQLKELLKG